MKITMTHLWLLLFLNSWLKSSAQGFGINLIKVPDEDRAQIVCTVALLGKYFHSGEALSGSVLHMSITSASTHVQQSLLHALHTDPNYPWTIVVKDTHRDTDLEAKNQHVLHEKPQCYFFVIENMEDEDMDEIFESWKSNLNWNPLAQFVVYFSAVEETEEEMTDIMIEILLNFMNKKIYNVNIIGQSEESSFYFGKTVFPYHPDNNCGNRVISIETLDICDYLESEREDDEDEDEEDEDEMETEAGTEEDGEKEDEGDKEDEREKEDEGEKEDEMENKDEGKKEDEGEKDDDTPVEEGKNEQDVATEIETENEENTEDKIPEEEQTNMTNNSQEKNKEEKESDEEGDENNANNSPKSNEELGKECNTETNDDIDTKEDENNTNNPKSSISKEHNENNEDNNETITNDSPEQKDPPTSSPDQKDSSTSSSSEVEYLNDTSDINKDYKTLSYTNNSSKSEYPKLYIEELYRALFLDKFPKDLSGCPLVAAYRPWEPYIFNEALDNSLYSSSTENGGSNKTSYNSTYGGEEETDDDLNDDEDYVVYNEQTDMEAEAQGASSEIRLNGIEYKLIQTIAERLHISIEMQVENSNLYHLFQQLIDG